MRHRRTWSRLVTACAATAALAGCIRDKFETGSDPGLRPGMVRIDYVVEENEAQTRATPTEGHERRVDDVHILFYSDGGSYITYQHASVAPGTSSFTFPVPNKLSPDTPYKTLVVGNSHNHVPVGYESFDKYLEEQSTNSYDQMFNEIYAERNNQHTETGSKAMPMWGKFVDGDGHEIPFKFTRPEGSSGKIEVTGSVRFSRCVCRLDLRNLAANKLVIDAVKLGNYRKAGYYFHNDVPKGELVKGIGEQTWVTVNAPSSGAASLQEMNAKIYAFPNTVPIVVQNDDQTTYLMIRGYYQDGTDNNQDHPKRKLTYYRFNMAQNGKSQILKRNNRYLGIISSVKGPGADDEQGAHESADPQLGYEVDDAWEDDDDNIATDDKGNFLQVSKVNVTFAGYKDEAEIVKVSVKEGLTWELAWDESLPGHANDKFSFVQVDDKSFRIITREDNATSTMRKARLIVKATGGSVNTSRPLTVPVNVVQVSNTGETAMLLVGGRTETIYEDVPGVGKTFRWQVETGTLRSGWKVEDVDNLAGPAGVIWTKEGANKGELMITLPPNILNKEQTFQFKVKRVDEEGREDTTVEPVLITLVQPTSDYLITVVPTVPPTDEGLVLEGFSDEAANPNGVSAQYQFKVRLADPTRYTWKVTSSFNKEHDAFLTKNSAASKSTQATWDTSSNNLNTIDQLDINETIWLNVFRTGPGDPDIKGSLTFTAVPKESGKQQSIRVTVTIRTKKVEIGDVFIADGENYILVADRNVGAPNRIQDGKFVPAEDFSNVQNMHITGKDHPENRFPEWKGAYYDYNQATAPTFIQNEMFKTWGESHTNVDDEGKFSPWYKTQDIDKWKVPTKEQLETLNQVLCYSKNRPFLVSAIDDKKTGNKVACYILLAGNDDYPARATGDYWSATGYAPAAAYSWYLLLDRVTIGGGGKSASFTVRCVRPVTKEEVQREMPGVVSR